MDKVMTVTAFKLATKNMSFICDCHICKDMVVFAKKHRLFISFTLYPNSYIIQDVLDGKGHSRY